MAAASLDMGALGVSFLPGGATSCSGYSTAVVGPTGLGVWEEAIAVWRADADEADLLIIPASANHPVGWIAVNGLASVDRVPWIKMLVVTPESWGRGYGTAPVRAAKACLASRGYVRAKLWTVAADVRARACYMGSGFTVERER